MLKIIKKDGKPVLATVVSNRVIKKRKSLKKIEKEIKHQVFNVEGNNIITDSIIAKDYIEAAELFYEKWGIVPYLSGNEKINGKCDICGKIAGGFCDVLTPDLLTCESCVDKEISDSWDSLPEPKLVGGKIYCQKSNTFDEMIDKDLYFSGHHKFNNEEEETEEGHYYYDDEGNRYWSDYPEPKIEFLGNCDLCGGDIYSNNLDYFYDEADNLCCGECGE